MATVPSTCNGCHYNYFLFIKDFYSNTPNFVEYLQAHGVLPTGVTCENCNLPCTYRKQRYLFYCGRYVRRNKTKVKKQCSFSVSLYKGTFLENTRLPPWEIAIFVNHWLQEFWYHSFSDKCLSWSPKTSIDWRGFCSEVTLNWLYDPEPIGGPDIIVEIDETFFVGRRYRNGREPSQVWLFGGIERTSKKKFIIPLYKEGEDETTEILLPLIKKYVCEGSIVMSDDGSAYETLSYEGYIHKVVKDSDPNDRSVHLKTIKQQWRSIKQWSKSPGLRTQFVEEYLARYLFLERYRDSCQHQFFMEAAKLYKPNGRHYRPPLGNIQDCNEDSNDSSSD